MTEPLIFTQSTHATYIAIRSRSRLNPATT